ncbi:hypothetical protein [Lactobacillus corticis]|uniref:Uncharacterized protein n=1 Tax=Lactobacillus corticis TaxID=2201249 RepID=A0A916VIH8_9LACO|nr:hypothetical protein [Lactobacillus corticis]GFZ27405.1 hypothetical protein LCB40_12850 [Lactobacillus corticis]
MEELYQKYRKWYLLLVFAAAAFLIYRQVYLIFDMWRNRSFVIIWGYWGAAIIFLVVCGLITMTVIFVSLLRAIVLAETAKISYTDDGFEIVEDEDVEEEEGLKISKEQIGLLIAVPLLLFCAESFFLLRPTIFAESSNINSNLQGVVQAMHSDEQLTFAYYASSPEAHSLISSSFIARIPSMEMINLDRLSKAEAAKITKKQKKAPAYFIYDRKIYPVANKQEVDAACDKALLDGWLLEYY